MRGSTRGKQFPLFLTTLDLYFQIPGLTFGLLARHQTKMFAGATDLRKTPLGGGKAVVTFEAAKLKLKRLAHCQIEIGAREVGRDLSVVAGGWWQIACGKWQVVSGDGCGAGG